jgi:hypothetical protein
VKLWVTVLHNVGADMFFRYDPATSSLFHAHTFTVVADSVEQAADLAWTLTNVGDADELRQMAPHLSRYADQVTLYRARMNRSLSVGDVLEFHEGERFAGALVVEGVGHRSLTEPPLRQAITVGEVSDSYRAHQALREEQDRRDAT